MRMQIQHNYKPATPQSKLLYTHPCISIDSFQEMLQLYIKELTFQGTLDGFQGLSKEEVEKLKGIISRIYKRYLRKELKLSEIEGMWPFLTFAFSNVSGLQLYLSFQELMTPSPQKNRAVASEIKEEQFEFDAKGYFQSNEWKQNPKFMRSLVVLERALNKRSEQDNKTLCLNQLREVANDEEQYQVMRVKLQDKFKSFQEKIKSQNQSKRILKHPIFASISNERIFPEEYVNSEPDLMQNTLKAFTQAEYINNHKTLSIKEVIEPIKEEPEEYQNIESIENIENNEEQNQSTITIKNKKTSVGMRSLPTKRRLEVTRPALATPQRRAAKRPPRHVIAERIFKLDRNSNILLEELRKTRQREGREKKRQSRLERVQRRIHYYSDDEEQKQQKRNKKDKDVFRRKLHLESEPESRYNYSNNREEEEELFLEESEDITMKRRRNNSKKAPIFHDFEEEESDNLSYHLASRNDCRMMIEEQQSMVLNKKLDPYSIGRIKANQQQNSRTVQALKDISLRWLRLGEDNSFQGKFQIDLFQYQKHLEQLEKKKVEKQIKKIIQEVVVRQQTPFDIDVALKLLAVWTVGKGGKDAFWSDMINQHIDPMLRSVIGVSFYRSIAEALNNFFVCPQNEDLAQLNRGREYFKTLLDVGRAYSADGLQAKIMEIFYSHMITPKKYEIIANQLFYPESSFVCLKNPFKIGVSSLKFKLAESEAKIAFMAGSMAIEALFLKDVVDHGDLFKKKQSEYQKGLKSQLTELDKRESASWFYSLTAVMKQFYMNYRPPLLLDNFLRLTYVITLSLQKLRVESITSENDNQTRSQIQFLLTITADYIQSYLAKTQSPSVKNLLSTIILQTTVKQIFGDKNKSSIGIMVYSTVLRLMASHPFFQTHFSDVRSYFINYVKDLTSDLSNNPFFEAKPRIYQPVFELVAEINRIQSNGIDCESKGAEIRQIIEILWGNLDKKYDEERRMMERVKSSSGKVDPQQAQEQIEKIKLQIDLREKAVQQFLHLFILPNSQQPLSNSSQYFFGLEFVLKHNYFIKYYQNRDTASNKFPFFLTEISKQYLRLPPYSEKKLFDRYIQITGNHFTSQRKELELRALKQSRYQSVLEVIALINSMNIVAALEKSKTRVATPQNSIMKLVSESIGANSCNYVAIVKSVTCFNFFLKQLTTYVSDKEQLAKAGMIKEDELRRVRCQIANYMLPGVKDIVLMIVLGGAARNTVQHHHHIPLAELVERIKDLQVFNSSHAILAKNIGYVNFLICAQKICQYSSITSIFSYLLQSRKILGNSDCELDRGVTAMLMEVYASLKKLQLIERETESITLECIRILCFILQWPVLLNDCIFKFWREMQVVSNKESLITRIRINDNSMNLLLRFFALLESRKENPHKIKETMNIYIDKVSTCLLIAQKEAFYNQAQRILSSIRECLKRDQGLQRIVQIFLKEFLKRFCSSQMLEGSEGSRRMEIYLDMMKNSQLERKVYEELIIENRTQFKRLLPKLKNNRPEKLYSSLQNVVLTCMIGVHSDLYDIKRLLGAMKKEECILSETKKKIFTELYQRLKNCASDRCGKSEIIYWCQQQLKQLKESQDYSSWMDVQ